MPSGNCTGERPSIGEQLLRLVYPAKCIFCGAVLPESTAISACKSCRASLPRYNRRFEAVPGIPYINGLFAAYVYEDEVESAIRAMKFSNQPGNAGTFAYLLYEAISEQDNIPDFDAIVPVPMHRRKRINRGYNQSELIAGELGKYLNAPVADYLVKVRHTKPQSLLGKEDRLGNLGNAIKAREGSPIKGLNILLVDDVTTTGTTLNTCARALYEAGASWIFAAVIAIAGK